MEKNTTKNNGKVWVIAVSMGYGHQRTAHPLRNMAFGGKVINADNYAGIPQKDKNVWETTRNFYEFISRFKKIPIAGSLAFSAFNQFQKILNFYPRRDLSSSTVPLNGIFRLIERSWGKHLILKLKKNPLPIVTTFFTAAFMAESFSYPNDIFCVICDADISRAWAPVAPITSKIKYLAPTRRVVERLKSYGVREESIFLTGFPLPLENIGSEKLEILRRDLSHRMLNLDINGKYRRKYDVLIKEHLERLPEKSDHILTLMFSIGGAGAQKEIGSEIAKSLREDIEAGRIKLILCAGTKKEVKNYFSEKIKEFGLEKFQNEGIEIISADKIEEYFQKFNQALRKTDIFWTKPSELSFYTALGLPVIIAPPVGSQEEFNRNWILGLGSGRPQKDPNYVNQWLFDWLNEGWFAEVAMEGFIEGKKFGTFNIQKIISENSKS